MLPLATAPERRNYKKINFQTLLQLSRLVLQKNRDLLVLKQPFTEPDHLKLIVLVSIENGNHSLTIEKFTLNFSVENAS